MSRLPLAIALLLGTAACKSEEIVALESVKQEICACKTLKVGDKKGTELVEERVHCAEAAMAKLPKPEDPSNHHAQQLAKEITDCFAAVLYDKQHPSTDPDREGSDTGSGSGSSAPTAPTAPTAPKP